MRKFHKFSKMSGRKLQYHLLQVMESVCGSLTEVMVETHRRRHLAYLMADHGALINPDHSTNLPKQQLNRFVKSDVCCWF